MPDPRGPAAADLLLLGGGHAHVEVLRRLALRPVPGARVTVLCREPHTPYSGMLPGLVAGLYGFDDAHVDLRRLARRAGARFLAGEATGLDPRARRVTCRDRPPLRYDLLSINSGATPSLDAVPGAADHAVPVKPIARFLDRWRDLRARVAARDGPMRIGVVGGGAGGVELLLAIRRALAGTARPAPALHIATRDPDILPGHGAGVVRRLRAALTRHGVSVHTGFAVSRVEAGALVDAAGRRLELDEILWVTEAAPAPWLAGSGLAVDARGFLRVGETLASVSRADVFAAGDVAVIDGHARPRAGVFAVRQGPVLADNLRRALEGRKLRRHRPQRRVLALIGTGDGRAVGSWGGLGWEGRWVWRWKDRIDRRFMSRYDAAPAMPETPPPRPPAGPAAPTEAAPALDPAMRCGGCGGKLGAGILARLLPGLLPGPGGANDAGAALGLDRPDDAAATVLPDGTLQLHAIDGFRDFLGDPWRFGRVAAAHALGDVHAMGGTPETALALAVVPYAAAALMEDDLGQMMQGARHQLDREGVALIGGHSAEGAELFLALAVTGRVAARGLLTKGGLRPGDALVLTRPLGTGILFAADMRARARARWVEAALASMLRPAGPAAACLRGHGATAATDVTGFGLLGHLAEMLGDDAGAVVRLDAVPALDGAVALAAQGLESSLAPDNRCRAGSVADLSAVAGDPRASLLVDPQTAGGLLAGVPADRADACIAALRALGETRSAVVGRVTETPGPPAVRVSIAAAIPCVVGGA